MEGCYVGIRVNYCGAVWTIGAMAAGAILNGAYIFMMHNAHGEISSCRLQILRIPSRCITRLFKRRHPTNHSRVICQRARKAWSALAGTPWNECLVDDGADEDAGFTESGGIAGHAFESQVAAHGHDVGGVIGMGEGDGVVGEMWFGYVDA
ncbi:hypothetical protein DPV78_005863 [Talaromyces pinophilus]|nr:hypothetical protein DPV78_005863 [Talaromyces pinophilus]